MAEKKISFTEIGKDLWAFTAEGDPNTGVIIGDDCGHDRRRPGDAAARQQA
jgi:hypothetical protein